MPESITRTSMPVHHRHHHHDTPTMDNRNLSSDRQRELISVAWAVGALRSMAARDRQPSHPATPAPASMPLQMWVPRVRRENSHHRGRLREFIASVVALTPTFGPLIPVRSPTRTRSSKSTASPTWYPRDRGRSDPEIFFTLRTLGDIELTTTTSRAHSRG